MTQTLRRELRIQFKRVLEVHLGKNGFQFNCGDELVDSLADAALEVAGIAKFDLAQADPLWSILAGKNITENQLTKQKEVADFEEMIEIQLNRFPLNWGGFKSTDQDRFRHHLKEAAEKGETLTAYMDWWIANKVEKESPPWTLGQIMIRWPQAFVISTQPKHSEGKAFYG